jgi:hypothetical protein
MNHPDRLCAAARLGELDVDAVCDIGASGHVAELAAVLVDVDPYRLPTVKRPALWWVNVARAAVLTR